MRYVSILLDFLHMRKIYTNITKIKSEVMYRYKKFCKVYIELTMLLNLNVIKKYLLNC